MWCFNPKVKARKVSRVAANVQSVVKRRQTIAANSAALRPASASSSRCNIAPVVIAPNEWADAGRKLIRQLCNTALQVRLMPPDGNCFYHAVADRLPSLGHSYTFSDLKRRAGAGHGDEADECHIRSLVAAPVPLRLKVIPVDADQDPYVLNWDAAEDLGDLGAPPLNLVHWRRRGVGKHFDVLEFRRSSTLGRQCEESQRAFL